MPSEKVSGQAAFGALLRRYRADANLTQEELAERSGVSVKAISALERGDRRSPRPSTVEWLAEALKLDMPRRHMLVAAARQPPGEPGLAPAATAAASRTLPRDVSSFTGREDTIDRVLASLSEIDRSVTVVAIDGMAGVGKTALAVHVAHQLSNRFPDGQLFLDMHAHTTGQRPVTTADALGTLLLTAGVAPQLLPHDLDARAALWRDRLAGRRILILLDDAASCEQVDPLLPGAPGCLVLITSRRRLAAMKVVESVSLDVLTPAQAAELFVTLAGRLISDAERSAVAELVELCGHLPLAVALLAGRLRSHPSWTVGDLADRVRNTQHRLAEVRAENVDVEAAFDMSYHGLNTDQQRLFRRLGLHPGREIDVFAAAALEAVTPGRARQGLETLYGDHLVDEPMPGRYRMHDLVRAYAQGLALEDDGAENEQAVDRLLEYYQQASAAATLHMLARDSPNLRTQSAHPSLEGLEPFTKQGALAWFEVQHGNLIACLHYAAAHSRPAGVVALAHRLSAYLRVAGHWNQALAVHQAAVDAAHLTGDRSALARSLIDISHPQRLSGRYADATSSLNDALAINRELGDRSGQAVALDELGLLRYFSGDYEAAGAFLSDALARFRDLGDQVGQASAHSNLGLVQRMTAEYRAALASTTEALRLYRDLGDELGEARELQRLGVLHWLTSDLLAARAALTDSLARFRDLGVRIGQAQALKDLGNVHRLTGDHRAAIDSLTEALAMYRDLGDRRGQANALLGLGEALVVSGEHSGATASLTDALALYGDLGELRGKANALMNLGVTRHLAGEYAAARASLQAALSIFRNIRDQHGEAEALNDLAALLLESSGPDASLGRHEQALRIARRVRSPKEEARALEGIGRCSLRKGDASGSIRHLREALEIYTHVGAPERERVMATLDGLPSA